jgi:hypothetical protein
MIAKLQALGVPSYLGQLILDFLCNRVQYVKTKHEQSSPLTLNTGAPQGCVLSPLLFVLYTNDLHMNSEYVKLLKYADDTLILGLISGDDESHYNTAVDQVYDWCQNNYLALNVTKTKELIYNFRTTKKQLNSLTINDNPIERVHVYKYLGLIFDDQLTFEPHVDKRIKKANQQLYALRVLFNICMNPAIISMIYNSTVASVLMYSSAAFYHLLSSKLKNKLNKPRKKGRKLATTAMTNIVEHATICNQTILRMTENILADKVHPLNKNFRFLPHNRRLALPRIRNNRFKNSFVVSAIKTYNSLKLKN